MANKIAYAWVIATVCTLAMINLTDAQGNPVTDVCMGCLCEAISDCDRSLFCNSDTCGAFRITKAYWIDGGKLTLNGERSDSDSAYRNCVNNHNCAATTVQNYMARYAKDCNNDNKIDCLDYAAIHKLGPFACTGQLPHQFQSKLRSCLGVYSN